MSHRNTKYLDDRRIVYRRNPITDIPTQENLIATNRTTIEIADYLGVEGLIYQDLEDLNKSVFELLPPEYNNKQFRFECSIFDGQY